MVDRLVMASHAGARNLGIHLREEKFIFVSRTYLKLSAIQDGKTRRHLNCHIFTTIHFLDQILCISRLSDPVLPRAHKGSYGYSKNV